MGRLEFEGCCKLHRLGASGKAGVGTELAGKVSVGQLGLGEDGLAAGLTVESWPGDLLQKHLGSLAGAERAFGWVWVWALVFPAGLLWTCSDCGTWELGPGFPVNI